MTEREGGGRLSAALQGFMVHWVQGAVWPVLLVYLGGGGQRGLEVQRQLSKYGGSTCFVFILGVCVQFLNYLKQTTYYYKFFSF